MQPMPPAQPANPLLKPTVLSLIAANAVPLIGVTMLGWDLREVLLLFWAESAVIGLYNVAKMLTVGSWRAIPLCVFFVIHYGIFMVVHLGFLLALTSGQMIGGSPPTSPDAATSALRDVFDVWAVLAVAALLLSHGVSFVVHFLRSGERPTKAEDLMAKPYGRIILMHVSIIFGTMLVLLTGRSAATLALLVVLKIIVDVRAHLREHRPADGGKRPPDGAVMDI